MIELCTSDSNVAEVNEILKNYVTYCVKYFVIQWNCDNSTTQISQHLLLKSLIECKLQWERNFLTQQILAETRLSLPFELNHSELSFWHYSSIDQYFNYLKFIICFCNPTYFTLVVFMIHSSIILAMSGTLSVIIHWKMLKLIQLSAYVRESGTFNDILSDVEVFLLCHLKGKPTEIHDYFWWINENFNIDIITRWSKNKSKSY